MSAPQPILDGNVPPAQEVERTSVKRVRISIPSSPSLQRNIRRKVDPSASLPLTSSIRDPLKAAKEARARRHRSNRLAGRSLFKGKGKRPIRPVQNASDTTDDSASDDNEADIDSDEEEVQLAEAGLIGSSSINQPISAGSSSLIPGSSSIVPTQSTFPVGETLKPFVRAYTTPPSTFATPITPRFLNLASSPRAASSSPVPEYIRLRTRAQSFSTPRIPDVDEILGETTDEGEDDSGAENDSDLLDEIEEEYQEKYRQDQANMSTPSVLLPSPFANGNQHKRNDSQHPSHSNTNRQIRAATNPYAKGRQSPGRMVGAISANENGKLGPSVTDLAVGFMQLESPVVRRAQPQNPLTPTSPSRSDKEESEIETGLMNGDEMQVDTAIERDVAAEDERVWSLTMLSSSDSESDVESRMDIPSTDLVRLYHQERLISLRSNSSLSFAGQRSRTFYRARRLTDVLEENPWIGSLKFARLVAIRRRGGIGGIGGMKFFNSLTRSGVKQRKNTKLEGVERMLVGLQQYRERRLADQARRESIRLYLNMLREAGLNEVWTTNVLMEWARLHSQADIFQRCTIQASAPVETQQAGPVENDIIELDNANALPVPTHLDDYAGMARTYQDTLENYEAAYPEARERLLARWRVNPAHFEQRRGAVVITTAWDAVFAAQDARDARDAEERRRRNWEEMRRRRRIQEEEADRASRERREAEMEQAAMRAAQLANWQAEFEAQRRSESVQVEVQASPFPTLTQADRQTQVIVAEAARELAEEIARNPDPPTYPASPTQSAVPTTPVMRATTVVPVTPPLPSYAPNTYGQASPPPPPPYNAISGYEIVEVDDLLLDDGEEDEDDIADLLSESSAVPDTEPAPPTFAAPAPQRVLTLAEMRAEQEIYQALAREAGGPRPARSSRCLIM